MKILFATLMSVYISFLSFSQDGSLDQSFGAGGTVTTVIGNETDVGYSIALQPDGKIVMCGKSYNDSNDVCALVRYNI